MELKKSAACNAASLKKGKENANRNENEKENKKMKTKTRRDLVFIHVFYVWVFTQFGL